MFRPVWCLTVFAVLFLSNAVIAQTDSISLGELTVRGVAPARYQAGLYLQQLDSTVLLQTSFRRLDEVLAQVTPLVFRNYGNGQLSTIAFRGLSASHTAVLWNGVNINMPSLGQTDFSALPAGAFDKIGIQYGTGATHLGTDAVGGSIFLESAPMASPGISLTAGIDYGSFQNLIRREMLRFRTHSRGKWELAGKTQFYGADYRNKYPGYYQRERRVEHSTTYQKGFQQDLYLLGRNGRTWSAHVWFNDNQMTIWPKNPVARELTGITAARAMIRYGDQKWQLKAFYLKDIIDYGTGDFLAIDRSRTARVGLKAEREWMTKIRDLNLTILAGSELAYFFATVKGYGQTQIEESRGDAFVLTRVAGKRGWALSLNMRQAFVEGYKVPFTPSFGGEYPLVLKPGLQMKITGSVARSYRVPTLNERYWKDLGNPEIRPESGWNKEAGLETKGLFLRNLNFSTRLNLYHNKVDHWIYWNPTTNYKAENLQLVVARGAEFIGMISYKSGKWNTGVRAAIGYTRTSQEKAYDNFSKEILGKQLRFVPVWTNNLSVFGGYGKGRLTLQLHQESVRYTTSDNSQFLPAYFLMNLLYEHEFKLWKTVGINLQGRVVNLADELYFNVKSNGMPGRSFNLSLLVDLNFLSKQP